MDEDTKVNKKLLIVTGVVFVIVAIWYIFRFVIFDRPYVIPSNRSENEIFCTLDAKICPDGSSVSRKPPSCDFDDCPYEILDASESAENVINKDSEIEN